MERRSRRLGRPGGRVRARQLDERRGAARVVVRAGTSTCVVSMGNKDDRLVERALDDGRQVAELDPSDTGDVGAPTVLLDPEAVERELVAEPVGRTTGAERARHAARVVAGELDRQRGRGGAVERRRKHRGGERPRSRDRQHREQQREDDEHRERAHEACVQRALDRAAPRPPRGRGLGATTKSAAGWLHRGG